MKTKVEFKKGILFIRISGNLTRKNISAFKRQVFLLVKYNGFRYIVLNLDRLKNIDIFGLLSLRKLNKIVKAWDGEVTICKIKNKAIKDKINNSLIIKNNIFLNDELGAVNFYKV